jgi:hypothetical protein
MTAFELGTPNVDQEIGAAIQFAEEAQELESFDNDWPWPRQSMRDYSIDINRSIDKKLPFLSKWVCLDQSYIEVPGEESTEGRLARPVPAINADELAGKVAQNRSQFLDHAVVLGRTDGHDEG